MEAGFRSELHHFYGMGDVGMPAMRKTSLEWDLNDWKWDGDLFIAGPLKSVQSNPTSRQFFPLTGRVQQNGSSSNCSSSCSDDLNVGTETRKEELEKRRRVDLNMEEVCSLSLNLGGHSLPTNEMDGENWEGSRGKKSKPSGGSANRTACQVEGCGADLSKAKDYHRRHKVCELHSKATMALVGNVMQRFCQQCSRFHLLQEFDEGKRSCRRRLAGHNKRRRKTNPDVCNGNLHNDEQTNGYLLLSLLRILSNAHSNTSLQMIDQNLLSLLLRNLGNSNVENAEKNTSSLISVPQAFLSNVTSTWNLEPVRLNDTEGAHVQTPSSFKPSFSNNLPLTQKVLDGTQKQGKMNNFDLNDAYVGPDDGTEDRGEFPITLNLEASSFHYPSWVQQHLNQSSPPQTSVNSDSASAQSPSSSNGDVQCRTDKIIFKLFGKEPSDFPIILRAQIFDWLSHSPSDIESYIRPGCIILTIYLCLLDTAWEELCCNLSSSLSRLLNLSDDTFWRTGWVYFRVQHQVAFIYNGRVVVDASLPHMSDGKIISVKPIAISATKKAQFFIKGINLSRPSVRLICAIEGNYVVQENTWELNDCVDGMTELEDLQSVTFICSMPSVIGRGFIEVDDHGLSCSFFPFLVAEEDVCLEIRKLECLLEVVDTDVEHAEIGKVEARNRAMEFIQEMGWLLHRTQLKHRLDSLDPNRELFSLPRFKWLMEFSVDHEWCAVVRKLLNILLSGLISMGEHSSMSFALSEMSLLHRAARRNSKFVVEFLLRFIPETLASESGTCSGGRSEIFLFRPDCAGPMGMTPLHIAAGKDCSEDVLDALTSDPGMVGIEAWKNAQDSMGYTPEGYARLRGHYSYVHLVQRKMNRKQSVDHVVLDIPGSLLGSKPNQNQKQQDSQSAALEIQQPPYIHIQPWPGQMDCHLCNKKLACRMKQKSMLYRPAVLPMVAIAAVCVCMSLLFKSCPEVMFVFQPFRWELLQYGAS